MYPLNISTYKRVETGNRQTKQPISGVYTPKAQSWQEFCPVNPYSCTFVLHPLQMNVNIKPTYPRLRQIVRFPRMLLWAFVMEGIETKRMLHTYLRQGSGKLLFTNSQKMPTAEELQEAHAQLRDIPRFLPFFVIVVVPAPGVTEGYALLAITLERWLGERVSLLPSHFRKIFQKEKVAEEVSENE